jgi:hypothetical protein
MLQVSNKPPIDWASSTALLVIIGIVIVITACAFGFGFK